MVTYVVCYDLGVSIQEQMDQVRYWLDFLNSSLSLPSRSASNDDKWTIILVGLRSDMRNKGAPMLQQQHLNAWKKKWPRLPIYSTLFTVSSTTSIESVNILFESVGKQCDHIFSKHCVLIPTSYRKVLAAIQSQQSNEGAEDDEVGRCLVSVDELFQKHACGLNLSLFNLVLQYLHAIGRIVLLSNGIVCTNASLVPQIAAKFVSPEEVRMELLKKESDSVQILAREEVGCLLGIDTSSNERFKFRFIYFR